MRTPAATRLVPGSDRLAMYSGNVSTLGSLSRSSDSSEGELPARHKRKGAVRGGAGDEDPHGLVVPGCRSQILERSEGVTEGVR